jgi:predicted NUDIX family phosphoesterase
LKEEHILVVKVEPTKQMPGKAQVLSEFPEILDPANLMVVQREMAETNPSYRQIIPYIVLRSPSGEVLTYHREKGVGEARLSSKSSIGVGGHIDGTDIAFSENGAIDLYESIELAARREIGEEFNVNCNYASMTALGFITDDSNLVGQVHLGVLLTCNLRGDMSTVKSKEDSLTLLGFRQVRDIVMETYEPWSQAALRFMKEQT